MTTGLLKIHLTAAAATVDTCVFQYLQLQTQPYVPQHLLRLSKNLIEQSVSWCKGDVTLFMCRVKF